MIPPVTIYDRFKALHSDMEADVLGYLQTVDPLIQHLHLLYGHPRTVTNALAIMGKPAAQAFQKYPLFAVFEDVPERGLIDDIRTINVRIIIATPTEEGYTRQQRDDKSFRPILIPIWNAFERHAKKGKYLHWNRLKPGDKTDRPYWGLEGVYGNEGHILNDKVDAMDVRMEFTIPRTRCVPVSFKNF